MNLQPRDAHMNISLKAMSEEGVCFTGEFGSVFITLSSRLVAYYSGLPVWDTLMHVKWKKAGSVSRRGDVQTPPWPLLSVRLYDNFLHSAHPHFFYCFPKLAISTVVLLYL